MSRLLYYLVEILELNAITVAEDCTCNVCWVDINYDTLICVAHLSLLFSMLLLSFNFILLEDNAYHCCGMTVLLCLRVDCCQWHCLRVDRCQWHCLRVDCCQWHLSVVDEKIPFTMIFYF